MTMNPRKLVPTQEPGVLDFAPGAAAAYSLRNLSLSYSGPVVTVRRSTDSAEADFTATEVSDGTLAAWCMGGDGFVKQWWDQSGNARHATASGTAQPQIVDSGALVTEGGRSTQQFDGIDDTFVVSVPLASSVTCFFLASPSTGTNDYLLKSNGAGGKPAIITQYNSLALEFFSEDRKTLLASGSQQVIVSVIQVDGGRLFGAVNGAEVFSATSASANTELTSLTNIGSAGNAGNWAESKISELLIYPTDMTALRQRIEGNLAWYY